MTPLPSSPSDPVLVCAVLWDKRVAEHISTQNDSQPDRGHFSASKKVECQIHSGRSPGSAMPQTTGLQYPVCALTVRGHCMYMNTPFCLCREWGVPPGSPSVVTTLTRLLRLGTSLRSHHAGHLHHAVSSCPHSSHGMGRHGSAVPCPLGTAQRSSRDAARD